MPLEQSEKDNATVFADRRMNRAMALAVTGAVVVIGLTVVISTAGPSTYSTTSPPSQSAVTTNRQAMGGAYGGTTTTTYATQQYGNYPTRQENSTVTSTTSTSNSAGALRQLRAYAESDLPLLRATVDGRWTAQLSSKKESMVANGVRYDATLILEDHLSLRSQYPGARLVWSGDWPSFKLTDYWVTIADTTYTTPEEANSWCESRGIPKDDCYAKRLRTSGGTDGNTKVR